MLSYLQTSIAACNAMNGYLLAAVLLNYLAFQHNQGIDTATINPIDRAKMFGAFSDDEMDTALSFLVANEFATYKGMVADVQHFIVTDEWRKRA